MNQKKCPKCGESNPPEAVMCWACYTPLAGGAVAGAGGVAATTATAHAKAPARHEKARSDDDDEKKAIAPWQIGAVLLALLLAGGFGFMMLRGDSGSAVGGVTDDTGGSGGIAYPIPGTGKVRIPGMVSPGGAGSTPSMTTLPQTPQNQPSYSVTTPPSRNATWATIGILPTGSVTLQQAAGLALIARQRLTQGRSYQGVYIYVFRDRGAAAAFQQSQRSRSGAPLQGGDYAALANVWPDTLVRYEYNFGNKSEDVRFPSNDAGNWWTRASNYVPARD